MKKITYMLSFLALALIVSACGDDGKKTHYCDSGFQAACEDGLYVYCEMENGASEGNVKETDVYISNNVRYVCNDNNELVPENKSGYSCKDGKLYDATKNMVISAACDANGTISFCDGNDVVSGVKGCLDSSMIYCENGQVRKESCGPNQVCTPYERNDSFHAVCFDQKEVGGGCDAGVTPFGTCDAKNALTFCTRKDASKGKTIRLDCAAKGQACMFIDDVWGNDCTFTCEDNAQEYDVVTVTGMCDKDGKVIYCDKVNKDDHTPIKKGDQLTAYDMECTDGKSCQFDFKNGQFDCL